MNKKNHQFFSSKVLLFGEYSVMKNSMALSLPFPLFSGQLKFSLKEEGEGTPKTSGQELRAFSSHLKELVDADPLFKNFDAHSFGFDIDQGLYFKSTIPQGFGVGSSGALCAAVYDAYSQRKETDILKLKEIFSLMEAHFHGKASGIDPLISYLRCPILLRSQDEILSVDVPLKNQGEGAVFLLNTGRVRRTEPLVNLFLEKCKQKEFDQFCEVELKEMTDQCINSFLEGHHLELFYHVQKLSQAQFEHFSPMIPKLFHSLWETGLRTGDYALKLCGAGGGGFILGMTPSFQKTSKLLSGHSLRAIYWY